MSTELLDVAGGADMKLVSAQVAKEDVSLSVQMAQLELNQAVANAHQFPRSLTAIIPNITTLATTDGQTATECVYALKRGDKIIKGPSIRFAEIVASQWGHCHVAGRIAAVDRVEKVVIAEGVFQDYATGLKRTAQVRRRIQYSNGGIFNDDMINTTGNAAAAIAMREAILKGVPKGVWNRGYEACLQVIAGSAQTLVARRTEALKVFAVMGVTEDQIFAQLGIGGIEELGLSQLGDLIAIHNAVKGEDGSSIDDFFPPVDAKPTRKPRKPAPKVEETQQKSALKPEPEEKPKAKPEPEKQTPSAKEAEPEPDIGPKEDGEPKADPAPEQQPDEGAEQAAGEDIYDAVMDDLTDNASEAMIMRFHGEAITSLKEINPTLHSRLMKEIAEAENAKTTGDR